MIWSSVRVSRVLHHDEIDAGIRSNVVDRDDVRVVERARRLRLLNEALLALRIGDLVMGEHLDRDGAIEMCVVCLVDDTHPALAELRFDPVSIERLADHRSACMFAAILVRAPNAGTGKR